MKFLKKFQKKPQKATVWNKNHAQQLAQKRAERQKLLAREAIEKYIDEGAEKQHLYEYTLSAAQFTLSLIPQHPHLGRKEVFTLGYQQILKNLDTEKILIHRCESRGYNNYQPYDKHLTPDDHRRYLNTHQDALKAIIGRLEANIQYDRQQLLEKQETVQNIRERLDEIREKQDLQEKDLDQKILAIQIQIDKVQGVLSLKTSAKQPPKFGF